jgi:hypothetical protein
MRSPSLSGGPQAIAPVGATPDSPARQGPSHEQQAGSRSFAELLAEAEAVQDTVEIRGQAPAVRAGGTAAAQAGLQAGSQAGPHAGLQARVQSAVGFLARQAPWMSLPLLLRRPAGAAPVRRPGRNAW